MAVQFHHVFTGEAARRPHQQQQGLIEPLATSRIHHMAIKHPVALPALLARGCKQLPTDRLCLVP